MSEKGSPLSLISEPLKTSAKNVLDPPTKAMGNSLADLWDIVFGDRISYARKKSEYRFAKKFDEFKAELEMSVSAIPIENQVKPDFQTVIGKYPCAGQITYTGVFSWVRENTQE